MAGGKAEREERADGTVEFELACAGVRVDTGTPRIPLGANVEVIVGERLLGTVPVTRGRIRLKLRSDRGGYSTRAGGHADLGPPRGPRAPRGPLRAGLMPGMKRVGVFAGSSPGARPEYQAVARELGRALGGRGLGLVYGRTSPFAVTIPANVSWKEC